MALHLCGKKRFRGIRLTAALLSVCCLTACGVSPGAQNPDRGSAAADNQQEITDSRRENSDARREITQPRHTEFFPARTHADLDFREMAYELPDVDGATEKMDAVRTLAADPDQADAVFNGFMNACDAMDWAETMCALAQIDYDQNADSRTAAKNRQESLNSYTVLSDAFYLLTKDILDSPCAGALDSFQIDRETLVDYQSMSDEELTLLDRSTELEDEYWSAAAAEYTTEYNGKIWNEDSLWQAWYDYEIDDQELEEIDTAIAKKRNAVLGKLFLRMMQPRIREASLAGYDNYADYAYESNYWQDYTREEIQEFHKAVKEYIVPVKAILEEMVLELSDCETLYEDFSGDTALDLMEPCLAELSDELLESFSYMRRHGLYDCSSDAKKNNTGYTVSLPSYGSAFFFNAPEGGLSDFTTAVHEFGHYNNFYWTAPEWDNMGKAINIDEVHSQGLELLFTRFYPELFGADSEAVRLWLLDRMLESILDGALYDELEQYAWTASDLTLEQLNQKYRQLCVEYGWIDSNDPRTEMYGWTDISHLFSSPFYYISYAVSASGAFAFWLNAQDDFFSAVDDYLCFTALDTSYNFPESFEEIGYPSPVSEQWLETLSESLYDMLDADAQDAAA